MPEVKGLIYEPHFSNIIRSFDVRLARLVAVLRGYLLFNGVCVWCDYQVFLGGVVARQSCLLKRSIGFCIFV